MAQNGVFKSGDFVIVDFYRSIYNLLFPKHLQAMEHSLQFPFTVSGDSVFFKRVSDCLGGKDDILGPQDLIRQLAYVWVSEIENEP